MALNSINTNIAAYQAQSNIGKASLSASSSIARLSSGNRIVRAADDVAAMSAGTSLRTNVTTLRMALINTSQGSSLLQVADGALSQVTDILQRQKSIAVQAGSGSLTSSERSFLDQEFQNLTQEIDRLTAQTNFNGVTLLNGGLSEKVNVSDVSTAATSASAGITFNINVGAGETLLLNGTTVTEGADFNAGGTIQDTIDNLVTFLNASTNTNLSSATYSRNGNSLVINADNAGVQGEAYRIDGAGTYTATANQAIINGGSASATINLFAANNIAAANITDSVVNATPTAAEPIDNVAITVDLGGGAVNLHTPVVGQSLEDIVNGINANTSTHGVTARIIGSSGAYNIQLEASAVDLTGGGGDNITLAGGGFFAGVALEANGNTVSNIVYSLNGGNDLGIGVGDTIGTGTIGDNLLTGQNQQSSEVSIIFPPIADADLNNATNFGNTTAPDITIEGVQFSFTAGGSAPTEAAIGSTLTETLDNMVSKINSYVGSGSENYSLDQIKAVRDGNNIVLRSIDVGNPTDIGGGTITVASTGATLPTGASITSAAFSSGQTGGVTTSGITNKDFIGTISGFNSTYTGTANTTDLSVTVGGSIYTATGVTTNPTTDTSVRFNSTDGGYFDIQLAANNGATVSSQTEADGIATRLNAAFSSLTFSQDREVSSYTGDAPILTNGVVTGTLIGTSVNLQDTNFSDVSIDSIRVNAPAGSNNNGSITFTIGGEAYSSSSNVGDTLGANSSFQFVSATDANKVLTFNTGDTAIKFDTDAKAATFEQALKDAFGVGNGDAKLNFQVGVTTSDTLKVGINGVSTDTIFNGAHLDVLTASSAATASDAIDKALNSVTAVRAEVGALQSRFDFAAANVESSIQNQDAARGVLLDTDIAAESTSFATAQVKLQAGISVLAQANQLPQNLLKLIR